MLLAQGEEQFACCALPVVLILVVFWLTQIMGLMNMPDSAFVGRNDKLIWALILLSLNALGAILFWFWKQGGEARLSAAEDVRQTLKRAADQASISNPRNDT